MSKLYMHTLNGYPARYWKGAQICYACGVVKNLATSLAQIKRERTASLKWRKKYGANVQMKYGHAILYIDRVHR